MTERTDPRTQKCSNFGVWASPGAACPRAWQYGKALPVHALWGFLSHELVRSRVLPSDTSSFLSYHLEYSACPRVTGGTRPLASPGAAREGSATRPHPPALAGEADRERGLPGQWRLRPGPLLTNSLREGRESSQPTRHGEGGPARYNHPQCCSGGCGSSCGGHRSSVPPPFRVHPGYWQSLWPQFLPWAPPGRELAHKRLWRSKQRAYSEPWLD